MSRVPSLHRRALVLRPDDVRFPKQKLRLRGRWLRCHLELRHLHGAGHMWRGRVCKPVWQPPLYTNDLHAAGQKLRNDQRRLRRNKELRHVHSATNLRRGRNAKCLRSVI